MGKFNLLTNTEGPIANISIALAASTTTDGIEAAITVEDAGGDAIAAVHNLECWISEATTGLGLTADTASGALTAADGAILTALTAKKHVIAQTDAAGLLTLLLVDSANAADQYFCVKDPVTGQVYVSAASGTNWEGA